MPHAAKFVRVESTGVSTAFSSRIGYLMASLVNYLLNNFFTLRLELAMKSTPSFS
jgi:putative flippase GtrA